GGSISTVSRAVVVLGIDAVRNIAITVLLFEHLQNKANAALLKEEFLRANLSALLAREIGLKMQLRETEEAYICAMFHGLGHLLAQYYFPEEIEEVRKLMALKECSEEAAVRQVLGLSLEELGIGIARSWGFPSSIINSMRRIPAGPVSKPATRDEMLRLAAGIANELCEAIADTLPAERHQAMRRIAVRYANGVQFPQGQLQATLDKSFDELGGVAAILRMNLKQSPLARKINAWSKGRVLAEAGAQGEGTDLDKEMAKTVLTDTVLGEATQTPADGGPAVAVPDEACVILSAGIQDISNSLVEDFSLNDLLRITLETMYRGMGFKRVLFCLREPKSGQMVGRFGFGPATGEILPHFRFPLGGTTDVFGVAVSRGVDILINDINDTGIRERIPDWYRQYVPGETFVLFPLRLKGVSVGLIYCDKDHAGEIVIPPRELSLLKTLRNQALLALKQAG
ncbi:MAG: HDOD domain-containing protein, partial [Pseudomonadota bacterium]